ncbi:uncharacterized protein F54H12.2 [Trichonephila clavipes]|nr:uncharacterized protein F54H12.2 [Trichonephila clavipes]
MEPVSVSRHNRKQVLKILCGDLRNEKPKAPRFKIGEVVRINKQKLHFEKGYEQNWKRELFTVYEIVQRIPVVYRFTRNSNSYSRWQWKQFHPLSNVFDNAPVEFNISGSVEDYIDLSQTQLYVKAKIVKVENTPITKDDTIGTVNLFLHSLFSQVDVSLNDRVVSNSSNTYPYRSYIKTLLNYGYDNKTSQLTAELFYKGSDDGLKKRTEFFKESATVDMIGCIHSDLFHQDRLLLTLVDLKIKLIRSKPEFCLQGSEGFKVVLDHVSLFIRKVGVNPGVILGHAKALEKTSAKYPINRVLCKVYSIPKGSMSFIQDNIFSGHMPKKLFVGCADNEAFHGAFSKSPYEFKHFNLNFIGVYVDGQPVPHNPLELDFSKDQFIRAYQTLFVGTDRMGQDRGEHLSLIKHSNLRLELKFSKSLEQTVSNVSGSVVLMGWMKPHCSSFDGVRLTRYIGASKTAGGKGTRCSGGPCVASECERVIDSYCQIRANRDANESAGRVQISAGPTNEK